jgi:hypothetical protein
VKLTTNFAITGLAATPITTRVQEDFLAHTGTLDHAVASPSLPTDPVFAANLLALGVINDCIDGTPSTMATALRAEFVPCLDDLHDRITTTEAFGPHLDDLDAWATPLRANVIPRLNNLDDRIKTTEAFGLRLDDLDSRATALCAKFVPRLDGLDAHVTKTDALLMAKIADYGSYFGHITRTAIPGVRTNLTTLAARVMALEGHPSAIAQPGINMPPPAAVPPAPGDPAPPLPAGIPPPHSAMPPVGPTVVGDVDPSDDGLGVTARSRIAWVGAHTPRQPVGNPYKRPPTWASPPRGETPSGP